MADPQKEAGLSTTSLLAAPPACMQAGGESLYGGQRRTRGRKRRFGIAGILNVVVTNLVLQTLLASSTISIFLATLLSQGLNTSLGYLIYGKIVFQAEGMRSKKPVLRYLCLMAAIWLLNTSMIEAGAKAGLNRNITAAAMIPALAIASYTVQKSWVFKK